MTKQRTRFTPGFDTHGFIHRDDNGDRPSHAATMAEAKNRFNKHTRAVLSDEARAALKTSTEWFEDTVNGPLLIIGAKYFFRFRVVSETGNCFAKSI